MRIYLAARWGRKMEMRRVRAELKEMGHVVTSRWLDLPENEDGEVGNSRSLESCREDADMVIEDMDDAEVCLAFTEPAGIGPMRGGRHTEVGYFLGKGKPVWVVGHHENIFHSLAVTRFFSGWPMLKLELMSGGLLCRI